MKLETRKIEIEKLILDYTLYPRNEVSSQAVTALVDAYTIGTPVPPVVADKKTLRVPDGFHRVHAQKRLGREKIDVVLKEYANDAELFADAVRMNAAHGRAFDNDDRKRAVIRLGELGFDLDATADIIHVPVPKIEEWIKGWGTDPSKHPVPVKGGLHHLRGKRLTTKQVETNANWSGMQPTFHVNQLIRLIEAKADPPTEEFRAAMDRLCVLWTAAKN